ncbi:hypothetical protein SALBM311S_07228 [Streptomyces alboniger]
MAFTAAEAGSLLARTVIAEGGRSLAALVRRLADRGVPVEDVVVAGSTVLAQPALYEAFVTSLASVCPGPARGPWTHRRSRERWRWPVHSYDMRRTPDPP